MRMMKWAENEIKLACEKKREINGTPEGEWDYGCACYESALKAYKSLDEDGHSGFSWDATAHILTRLLAGKPLTPVEDVDDVWESCDFGNRDYGTYQCKRMSSLFKDVYPDGTVKYHDTRRVMCVDSDNEYTYYNSFISRLIHEMFPIGMPYMPELKPYKVYVEDILSNPKNGDWDTMHLFYALAPDGNKYEIDRFFKFDSDEPVEIDVCEYSRRLMAAEKLEEEKKNDI